MPPVQMYKRGVCGGSNIAAIDLAGSTVQARFAHPLNTGLAALTKHTPHSIPWWPDVSQIYTHFVMIFSPRDGEDR